MVSTAAALWPQPEHLAAEMGGCRAQRAPPAGVCGRVLAPVWGNPPPPDPGRPPCAHPGSSLSLTHFKPRRARRLTPSAGYRALPPPARRPPDRVRRRARRNFLFCAFFGFDFLFVSRFRPTAICCAAVSKPSLGRWNGRGTPVAVARGALANPSSPW